MKKQIFEATLECDSLEHILVCVVKVFQKTHPKRVLVKKIGYVSGMISSEGIEHIDKNIKILQDHTEKLSKEVNFPIFSAVDIFFQGVFERIEGHKLTPKEFMKFWRQILKSGYITDIFMTPRWEKSLGAVDEYKTAKKLGLKIHYIEPK